MGLKFVFVNENKYGQKRQWFNLEKIGFGDHYKAFKFTVQSQAK